MSQNLTPYDTGERFQPRVWVASPTRPDSYGRVDFENDEGATDLTVFAGVRDGRVVLEVEATRDIDVIVDGTSMLPVPAETGPRMISLPESNVRVLLDALDDAVDYWEDWEQQYDLHEVYDEDDLAAAAQRRADQAAARELLVAEIDELESQTVRAAF